MRLALRGIMDAGGDIHSWPTAALTHDQFFAEMPFFRSRLRARWRQWEPNGPIDFDPGVSAADKAAVEAYVSLIVRELDAGNGA